MRHSLLAAVAVLTAPAAFAGWGITVNIGPGAPYYGYAPADVVYVERYVPAYDVPRVFVISRYARVRPALVVDYYRRYPAWGSVCYRFGVPQSTFYNYGMDYAPRYIAPPRGHGHGHYKARGHRGRWRD